MQYRYADERALHGSPSGRAQISNASSCRDVYAQPTGQRGLGLWGSQVPPVLLQQTQHVLLIGAIGLTQTFVGLTRSWRIRRAHSHPRWEHPNAVRALEVPYLQVWIQPSERGWSRRSHEGFGSLLPKLCEETKCFRFLPPCADEVVNSRVYRRKLLAIGFCPNTGTRIKHPENKTPEGEKSVISDQGKSKCC